MEALTLWQEKGRISPRVSRLRILSLPLLILTTVLAAAPQEKKRLTAENIMDLLSGGVNGSRVTYLVLERGVDFKVTPKLEKAFEDAGADPALVAAIRKTGPPPAAPSAVAETHLPAPPKSVTPRQSATGLTVHSQPGGAAIFIDGELKGETDPQEGVLVVAPLTPGKHRLRATAQGYDEVEGPAEVVAGQLAEIPVTLAQTEAPPLAAAELPAGRKFRVRHIHRPMAGVSGPAFCEGWMVVNVGYVRYISTDTPHKYLMSSSEIREVKLSSGGVGLTIRLDFGRKYDFVAVDEKGHEVSAGPAVNEINYSMGK